MITYLLTNTITGDTYVGRTKLKLRKRMSLHQSEARTGSNHPIHCSIRENGWDNFEVSVLCEEDREKEMIKLYQPSLNIPYNPPYKRAVETTSRGVKCVETGEVFESISQAERSNNISRNGVSNVLNGRAHTAGGYHWEYTLNI